MDRWFSYFFERMNPLSSLLVIAGISTSTAILDYSLFNPINFMASCLVWFFLMFLFRIRNDLDNFDKDKVAYPERPLQRGLIQKKEAEVVVKGLEGVLIFLGVAIFLYYGTWSRLLVFVIGCYFWLIRHNFYLGKRLDQRPLAKTLACQGILLPMILLSISFSHPQDLLTGKTLSYTLLLFGSFFTFELCRKLNPLVHPAAQSLIHFFGFKKVFRFILVALFISTVGAFGFGAASYLVPLQFLIFVALIYMFKNPRRYAFVQMLANISLVVHSWSAVFERI